MIRFLLKKAFHDGWDNFFGLVLLNLPFSFLLMAAAFLGLSLVSAGQDAATAFTQILFLSLTALPLGLHAGAVSWAACRIAGGEPLGFKTWLEGLRRTWLKSLAAGLIVVLLPMVGSFGFLFYARMGGLAGWALAGLLFWILLALCLILLYLFPLIARAAELRDQALDAGQGTRPRTLASILKRDLLFVLDNLTFSLAILLVNILCLPLSLIIGGLLPGPSWGILLSAEALRMRMLKYDWLEANPEADRRKIPWRELLAPERELLGERSLKGFFFPWKDSK